MLQLSNFACIILTLLINNCIAYVRVNLFVNVQRLQMQLVVNSLLNSTKYLEKRDLATKDIPADMFPTLGHDATVLSIVQVDITLPPSPKKDNLIGFAGKRLIAVFRRQKVFMDYL